jgi:hypothetical protein
MLKLVLLSMLVGCGGGVGRLDGDYSAVVVDLRSHAAAPCGGDGLLTLSGPLTLHEDPPGVLSGNVVLCGERAAVLGQVDAAGGFDLAVADFGLRVTQGKSSAAGLDAAATTPRGPFGFRATRR